MLRRVETIAQQNIGTTLTHFDFSDLWGYQSCTIVPMRADEHWLSPTVLLVSGVTSHVLAKVLKNSSAGLLLPIVVPLFFDTFRLSVVKVSGTANPFSAQLIFSDQPFIRPYPGELVQSRTTVTASNTTAVVSSHPCSLFSSLGISVATSQEGIVKLDWVKPTADVIDVPVITLAAAGQGYVEVPISASQFDLKLTNSNGASSNIFDISVRGLP